MLSPGDFFLLQAPLSEEVRRLLPLPATVEFALLASDGSLQPLQPQPLHANLDGALGADAKREPGMVEDCLVIPLTLPSGASVAVVISGTDPALLRKMSPGWLREMRAALLQELALVQWGYIDPEAEMYNRRAALAFLQEPAGNGPVFFLLLNTVFHRRSATGNLQKLREIADLLQALTQAYCFSFGYGVFGVMLFLESREQVLKAAHYLQHQLRREGLSRAQIGFGLVEIGAQKSPVNAMDTYWRALAIAEKRGPFGLCDIDAVDARLPHPFQLPPGRLRETLPAHWRGLSRFTLALLSRQPRARSAGSFAAMFAGFNLDGALYLGEQDDWALLLLPEIDQVASEPLLAMIAARCKEHAGEEAIAFGVASWPCLDFRKSDTPGNCLKALLHGSYLASGTLVVFDHVSLNVSGDLFFDEGDYRAAIREYRRGLRLQPGDLNLANSLGVALVECGQERQAAACFQGVLAREPENYMALVNLGHVRHALAQKQTALECFERAYRVLARENVAPQELLLPLGKLYAEFGEHEKALAVFSHWRTCPGSEKEFLLFRLLGQSYLENGQPGEAMSACQRALQLFPQDSTSLSTLGVLYVEQGEGNDLGLALCRKALALDNFNPDHWYRLGRALLHVGEHAEALAAGKKCLELRRNHVEGLLLLGTVQTAGGRVAQAVRYFQQAIAAKNCTERQAGQAREFLEKLTTT